MPFQEKLPDWHAEGVEPPESKRNTGWEPGERPPAEYWNWQMNRTYKALQELQQKAAEKEDVATIADLNAHINTTTGVHGATSAATPNTIVQRDANGRFKAGAPSDPDDVARKAEVDAKLSLSGGTMTGKLNSAGSSGSIADSAPNKGMIEVRSSSGTDAAFMTFHRVGVHASYFGIDVDNKWKVGGWSAGSSAREIWHEGNLPVETGNWTPIITSTFGSNNHSYEEQNGRYVRMGNLVFVWGIVFLTAKDPEMDGNVFIGGLPFRVANDGHYPAANIGYYRNVAKGNSNELTARFDQNSTVVSFWEGGDNLGPYALPASKITDTTQFAIGGVYKTND